MIEIDELLLMSGLDVPFPAAQLQIHQPQIRDISIVGEKRFFAGAAILQFDKDILKVEDNSVLDKLSDFDIIMTIVHNQAPEFQEIRINLLMLLSILFPTCTIELQKDRFLLKDMTKEGSNEESSPKEINSSNYEEFKTLLNQILCLDSTGQKKYNPQSAMAKRIAAKLKKGRQKASQDKGENLTSLLSRYVSILAVGLNKDINSLMNYTLYQLFEEYKRYSAKLSFDMNMSARLAGAKDVSTPKNWMDNLDEDSLSS